MTGRGHGPGPAPAGWWTQDRHPPEGADVTAVLTRPLPPQPGIVVRPDDAAPPSATPVDVVDQWGMHSFPASDPPSNW
jgi:hypothetical protein